MVSTDWSDETKAMWQHIANAVEEPCGACRGGKLRLYRLTREANLLAYADKWTAITRCDHCEIEMAVSTNVLMIDVVNGNGGLRWPRELDANKG